MEENKENLDLSQNFNALYDVDKDDVIGRGHYSTVRRAIHRETGRKYAAKFIRRYSRSFCIEDFNFEVQALTETSGHPYFVNFYGTYENFKEMIIIQELAPGADLFSQVDASGAFPESQAVHIIFQLLEAVQYLHSHNIVHLDLKPENIIYDPDSTKIKVIDFGLSRKIHSESALKRLCGTPEYVAPEVIKYDPITLLTDMWSIGAVTYFILSSVSPFCGQNDQETLSNVTSGSYRLDIDEFMKVSSLAKDFIQKLLISNPKKRMNCEKCLSHAWITNRNDSGNKLKPRKSWKSDPLLTPVTTPYEIIILVIEACIFLRKMVRHSNSKTVRLNEENNVSRSSKPTMNNLCMLQQPCAVLLSC